jgi:AcrR family transcriptional regulator
MRSISAAAGMSPQWSNWVVQRLTDLEEREKIRKRAELLLPLVLEDLSGEGRHGLATPGGTSASNTRTRTSHRKHVAEEVSEMIPELRRLREEAAGANGPGRSRANAQASDRLNALMRKAVAAGATHPQLAEALGMSISGVRARLRRGELEEVIANEGTPPRRTDCSDMRAWAQAYATAQTSTGKSEVAYRAWRSGVSISALAAEIGVATSTLYWHRDQHLRLAQP